MVVSILGCGWFGLHFATSLVDQGFQVKGSTTSQSKLPMLKGAGIEPHLIDLSANINLSEALFFKCDILVIAISPGKNKECFIPMMSRLPATLKKYQVKKV